AAGHVRLCALEVLIDPVAEERNATTGAAEDLVSPPTTDEVADRVSHDRARDRCGDDRREGYPTVERQDPSQDHRDLAGEHEAEEGRGLERGHEEHDRQGDPAIERQDPVADPRQHLFLPEPCSQSLPPVPVPDGAATFPGCQPISGWSSHQLWSPSWRTTPHAVICWPMWGGTSGNSGMISSTRKAPPPSTRMG